MASVTLNDVVKVYENGVRVVDQLNLAIANREFVVLVGPSGCGKSTTLRMIAGLEDVTSGTIRIGERVVNDVPPKDRDIAMVFQSYALYPHMTVYENMAFALKLRKHSKPAIEEKVRRAAKTLGIENLLDRKPRALSGGQRQRVALGRAIVRDPQCFLFDEPLSNLDAKLRVEMRAEIKRLHLGLDATTVYVTHDQEEAMTLGDRVVVMRDGLIQQCGGALDIYHRPQNRFVAGFLGNPPMNFFECRVEQTNGAVELVMGSGAASDKLPVPEWSQAALSPWLGKNLVLGIRPEAIAPRDRARFACDQNFLNLQIMLVQPLGAAMDVVLSRESAPGPRSDSQLGSASAGGSAPIIAHLDAAPDLAVGQRLPIYFDMDRAHFFEPGETGARIVTGPS